MIHQSTKCIHDYSHIHVHIHILDVHIHIPHKPFWVLSQELAWALSQEPWCSVPWAQRFLILMHPWLRN